MSTLMYCPQTDDCTPLSTCLSLLCYCTPLIAVTFFPLEVLNCLIFRYNDHSFLFKSQLGFGMQINLYRSKRKLYLEEKLSHSQNAFHSIVRCLSFIPHSLALFSPFIELLEMNHSLNGPHASQLTCDAGFISRDWKSFLFFLLPAESLKRISLGAYDGSAWYFSLIYRQRDE